MHEGQRVAVVQLCVDDRLDHAAIRAQVAAKLRSIYLRADRIFLVNEIGGNFGQNFRNTVDLFVSAGAEVVFAGLLHHDDCGAAAAGKRLPLEQSSTGLAAYLASKGLTCSVYTGHIATGTGDVTW